VVRAAFRMLVWGVFMVDVVSEYFRFGIVDSPQVCIRVRQRKCHASEQGVLFSERVCFAMHDEA
jgi:hypothetical protein